MPELSIDPGAVYCFIDTDVLMHFTTFDQVDWLKFLDAKQVYLVLTITVINELNKHKDDGSKPHLQDRARNVLLPKIFTLLTDTTGPVRTRESVFLLTIPREPIVDWRELELDANVKDDRIFASIILFKEQHPDANVVFLTHDHSSVLKARYRAIRVVMPDDKLLKRTELKDSLRAELRAVKDELREYKNRLPKLEFGFNDGQKLTKTIICPHPGYNAMKAEMLARVLDDDYIPHLVTKQRAKLEQTLNEYKGDVSDYKLKEYTEEYKKYLKYYAPAIKRRLMNDHGQRCCLSFIIGNTGTASVNDLTINLHFPPGTLVLSADDDEKEYEVPKEPRPSWILASPPSGPIGFNFGNLLAMPKGVSAIPSDFAFQMSMLRTQHEAQRTHWGPLCSETQDSHIVSYRAKKLQHGNAWEMRPVVAYLIPNDKQGFSIDYYIHFDENLRKTSGKLHVQWK